MKQIIIITILVLILSGFALADDRTGIFPINNEQCIINENPEENQTINESKEIIVYTEEQNKGEGNHVWCAPKWICTEWTECSEENKQTRTCYDEYNCEAENNPPITEQGCNYAETNFAGAGDEIKKTQEVIIETNELTSEENPGNQITGAIVGGAKTSLAWLIVLIALISTLYIFVFAIRNYKSGTA